MAGLASMATLDSCSDADTIDASQQNAISIFDIMLTPRDVYDSRASISSTDNWTITNFQFGDATGFFTTKGNLSNEDDPDAEFPGMVLNGRMEYLGTTGSSYRFGNSEIRLDPSLVATGSKYMYYPYTEIFDNSMDGTSTEGVKLRKDDNGVEKCIDYMYASEFNFTAGVLSPSFKHLFAEIIIIPGEGFDKQEDQEIKVVIGKPWTDLRVKATVNATTNLPSSWTHSLLYNGPDTEDAKLAARTWEAWRGEDNKGRKAWYALLPTTASYSGSPSYSDHHIAYFEIKDNYGHVQQVSDFYFYTYNHEDYKTIYAGYRYPLEVVLTELGVLVRPVLINGWDDPQEITDKREKGISDYVEYENWASLYNTYIETERAVDKDLIDQLLQYGDAIDRGDGTLTWTFYIIGDIEFEDNSNYQLVRFEDALEGASNSVNFTISNIKKTLFREITSTASITKLDFKDLYIASSSEDPVGGLVTTINGGRIENCNVSLGIVVGEGPVGMIAGMVNDGTVNYCTVSGSIFGSETSQAPYFGLFGTEPTGASVVTDNNSNDLIFESNR